MVDTISEIFTIAWQSHITIMLSATYFLLVAASTYDSRLIQQQRNLMSSGVAVDSRNRYLPSWAGYLHFIQWGNFLILFYFDWRYAIVLYLALLLLRVLPVMERIGWLLMKAFLKDS